MSVSISVDVPNLEAAVRFFGDAFGFRKSAEPIPGVVVLDGGNLEICLLEKGAGSEASIHTQETRHYERHWTPVHFDIHVDDFETALARALEAGAIREQLFENPKHGSVAFLSDPFGHGFCIIERKRKS